MTDDEKGRADVLLGHIEQAVGALPDRTGTNAPLIRDILQAVLGLRSIMGVVRPH